MIVRRVRAVATLALLAALSAPASVAVADPVEPDSRGATQAEVEAAQRAVAAGAGQVAALQRQLDVARAEVEALHEAAGAASEKANAAREQLARKTAEAAAARKQADEAAAAAQRSQSSLEQMAAQLYMRGGPMADLAWLFTGSTAELARDRADVEAAEGHRTRHLTDARRAESAAAAARTKADAAQKAQQAAATEAATALADVQKAVAAVEKKTTELTAKERQLVTRLAELRRTSVEVEQRRQEQLQREAAERAQAQVQARLQADVRRGAGSSQVAPADLPAPNTAAAATAIAWAQQQLGKPYKWGGNGPDSFDCSGLMVGAWRAAGKSLPRTAQWQYDATPRVAIADLQPGDLVFFGSSNRSITHVGMYVGGGQMIEAPRTGLDLRYSSIYRSTLLPHGGRA